jgi:hypothetical protein
MALRDEMQRVAGITLVEDDLVPGEPSSASHADDVAALSGRQHFEDWPFQSAVPLPDRVAEVLGLDPLATTRWSRLDVIRLPLSQ